MEVIYQRCAGIDTSKKDAKVCVRRGGASPGSGNGHHLGWDRLLLSLNTCAALVGPARGWCWDRCRVRRPTRGIVARCSESARVVPAFISPAGSASAEVSVGRRLAVYSSAASDSTPGTARNTPLKSSTTPVARAAPTVSYQTGRPRGSSLTLFVRNT
jgi:hypothetical protein